MSERPLQHRQIALFHPEREARLFGMISAQEQRREHRVDRMRMDHRAGIAVAALKQRTGDWAGAVAHRGLTPRLARTTLAESSLAEIRPIPSEQEALT